jgi:hypothetical protein
VIREMVESSLTPATGIARRLGYVDEVVAIGARERRHRRAWAAHLEYTRAFVDEVAVGGDHLVVLGSGRLLDVPLERVARRYARTTLVDMVHPRVARRRAAAVQGVVCVEGDVTGCAARLCAGQGLPEPARPVLLDGGPPPTTTISLNLASQLAVAPSLWLERHGFEDEVIDRFGTALVTLHLEWLSALPGSVGLVTDVRRRYTRRGVDGEAVESSLFDVARPPADRCWTWEVAPEGEIEPEVTLVLDVEAFVDWKAARARARTHGTSPSRPG